MSLHEWLEQWASGLDLWKRTVTFENKTINDPLTGGPKVVEVISGVKGADERPVQLDAVMGRALSGQLM